MSQNFHTYMQLQCMINAFIKTFFNSVCNKLKYLTKKSLLILINAIKQNEKFYFISWIGESSNIMKNFLSKLNPSISLAISNKNSLGHISYMKLKDPTTPNKRSNVVHDTSMGIVENGTLEKLNSYWILFLWCYNTKSLYVLMPH